jgi:hypothetical protein
MAGQDRAREGQEDRAEGGTGRKAGTEHSAAACVIENSE